MSEQILLPIIFSLFNISGSKNLITPFPINEFPEIWALIHLPSVANLPFSTLNIKLKLFSAFRNI